MLWSVKSLRVRALAWMPLLLVALAGCAWVEPRPEVSLDVRNEGTSAVILEIIEAPDEVNRPPVAIAPPIEVSLGEHVVDITAPSPRWALRVRGEPGFLFSDELIRRAGDPGFHVVIGSDGAIKVGTDASN